MHALGAALIDLLAATILGGAPPRTWMDSSSAKCQLPNARADAMRASVVAAAAALRCIKNPSKHNTPSDSTTRIPSTPISYQTGRASGEPTDSLALVLLHKKEAGEPAGG